MNNKKLKIEIFKLSTSSNLEEVRKEWRLIFKQEDVKSHCICGKAISQVFIMENKINKNIIHLGNECVKEFKHIYNDDLMMKVINSLHDIKNGFNKYYDEMEKIVGLHQQEFIKIVDVESDIDYNMDDIFYGRKVLNKNDYSKSITIEIIKTNEKITFDKNKMTGFFLENENEDLKWLYLKWLKILTLHNEISILQNDPNPTREVNKFTLTGTKIPGYYYHNSIDGLKEEIKIK